MSAPHIGRKLPFGKKVKVCYNNAMPDFHGVATVFSQRLRTMRQARGLRQVALARMAGVSPALISRMEDGSRPRAAGPVLERLATVLSTSTDYLLGLTADPRHVLAIDALTEMERDLIAEFRRLPSEPWQRAVLEEARRLRALQEEVAAYAAPVEEESHEPTRAEAV